MKTHNHQKTAINYQMITASNILISIIKKELRANPEIYESILEQTNAVLKKIDLDDVDFIEGFKVVRIHFWKARNEELPNTLGDIMDEDDE